MCSQGECDNGSAVEAVYSPICKTFLRAMMMAGNGNGSENNTLGGAGKNMPTKHGWFDIVIPIISFLGIVGNILNLIVYTRRRMLSSMDRLEKSATYGLVGLALSDMFFCMAVFPHTFVAAEGNAVDGSKRYQLYYQLYGLAFVNLFLMVSTWLIVTMSINRYIVVVYPLHARSTLSTSRTAIVIILVYVLSGLITSPFFFHLKVGECYHPDGRSMYQLQARFKGNPALFSLYYIRWMWAIVADFIPIGILAFCNTRLIWELRRATSKRRKTAHGQKIRDSSHKVTLTLVIIVLMLLFLVSPSEILRYINPYKAWGTIGQTIANVTNMLQAINFAFNFILYCVVSPTFRQTFKAMFSRCLKDKGDKAEMHSMLTHGSTSIDKTMMTDAELDWFPSRSLVIIHK